MTKACPSVSKAFPCTIHTSEGCSPCCLILITIITTPMMLLVVVKMLWFLSSLPSQGSVMLRAACGEFSFSIGFQHRLIGNIISTKSLSRWSSLRYITPSFWVVFEPQRHSNNRYESQGSCQIPLVLIIPPHQSHSW